MFDYAYTDRYFMSNVVVDIKFLVNRHFEDSSFLVSTKSCFNADKKMSIIDYTQYKENRCITCMFLIV